MGKIPFAGIEPTSQRVRRLHGHLLATGATGVCVCFVCIMQGGVLITPQEAVESGPNEAPIDYESSLRLKAVKNQAQTLAFHNRKWKNTNTLETLFGARHDLHRPRTAHKRFQETRS